MNIIYFSLLGMMVFYARTLAHSAKPYYALVFFSAALSHQICDFIQCEWNPFGPWDLTVFWGLFLACNGCTYCNFYGLPQIPIVSPYQQIVFFDIFELIPHFLVLIIFSKTTISYYKKIGEFKSQKN